MSKEGDFLDLDVLDKQVANPKRTKKSDHADRVIGSPTSAFAAGIKRNSVIDRNLKKRDEKLSLEKKISELEKTISAMGETISLKMPVSKLSVQFKKMMVNPELIDISPENQRLQSLLDMSSVSDIYESIQQEGQSEPGFLRPTENNRFELVSGSRRLFCVKHIPGRQYLALVGDIPDVDVRRLSRLENQQSPISVYERALSFRQDIKDRKVKSWEALAAMEGLSDRQIKKYKALSEMPIEVVKSFTAPSDMSLEFADWIIAKIRKSSMMRTKVVEVAISLIEAKETLSQKGVASRSAQDIMTEYKSRIRSRSELKARRKPAVYSRSDGGSIKHTISSRGTHKLEFIDLAEPEIEACFELLLKKLKLNSKR